MNLSYTGGPVVVDSPVEVTYTVEEGDPALFFFQVLVDGQLSPVGPSGDLSTSETFTSTQGLLGPHVIAAFEVASGSDPEPFAFASGPTFTVVEPAPVSTLLTHSGSVTIAYEVFSTGTSTIIIEETAVPASSTTLTNATYAGLPCGTIF
ncbi:hypothetical protein FB45DRAFT_1057089 [Roridomyces roridus]|uniref:Uncharacterized protein n=1 Tax=Roridomyces roridus TaxID=1738132 RepID=A0AAD7C087_9AGAR|nr:hypothetical protein FB45DRAFT_1057089 [Roridomyces roridus]